MNIDIATLPVELLDFYVDGAKLDGLQSLGWSGGSAPTRERATVQGKSARTGLPGVPVLNATFLYAAGLSVWDDVAEAIEDGTPMLIHYQTKKEQRFDPPSAGRVAIATTGVVTFSGGNVQDRPSRDRGTIFVGSAIELTVGTNSDQVHIVQEIDSSGASDVIKVKAISTAIAAQAYDGIFTPSYRRGPFAATLPNHLNEDFATNDGLVSLAFQPFVTPARVEAVS